MQPHEIVLPFELSGGAVQVTLRYGDEKYWGPIGGLWAEAVGEDTLSLDDLFLEDLQRGRVPYFWTHVETGTRPTGPGQPDEEYSQEARMGLVGLAVTHQHREALWVPYTTEHELMVFPAEGKGQLSAALKVESFDPLTVEGELQCSGCELVGRIEGGLWVDPAAEEPELAELGGEG